MDRNEVVLVGRLSGTAEDKTLPSGDTLTKWRLVVRRRRRHRRGGTLTDSIPCVTFDEKTAELVRSLQPPALLEVTGAFRCRIYGPSAAKVWRYEVEVLSARPVEADPAQDADRGEPPAPSPPRPVAALAAVG
ncbi:single-stranded DNA-binding protein [Nonomuraea indica]|uniref:Single-stranded DNA-binding protein n=1 Tax=Nonomuraea indica TaxID=1581193 RepID=A0ABW8A6I8_9ACTN